MEARRREELRREAVGNQVQSIVRTCRAEIAAIRDPVVQQYVARDLEKLHLELGKSEALIRRSPNDAMRRVNAARKQLHRTLANARAKAKQWSRKQAKTQARIAETRAAAQAERETASDAGAEVLAHVDEQITQAVQMQELGRHDEAMAACDKAGQLIEESGKATFDETVRREVVGSLMTAFQARGFTLDQPLLEQDGSPAGVVALSGSLPSGKTIRVQINVNGEIAYDLNGYQGRTCAKQIDELEQALVELTHVRLGPAQHTWKTPDRISKGARSLPTRNHAN
ncbi:MAG: hypothetical protein CL908_21055 [Deltaproteobacteria bacterium]|nr:hypothetical protein [Deltaproteobacteria bacterium]